MKRPEDLIGRSISSLLFGEQESLVGLKLDDGTVLHVDARAGWAEIEIMESTPAAGDPR